MTITIPDSVIEQLADAIAERLNQKLRESRTLTTREAAEYVGKKPDAFRHWYRGNGFKPDVQQGTRVRFRVETLNAWMLTSTPSRTKRS